ncbi:MAG: YfhO family protein [Thermomicrobium sp.]|nr:YfhO family protein [Thermomicrobium sp.]
MGVDLAARTSGLLSPWAVLVVGLAWSALTVTFWWQRSRLAGESAALGSLALAWLLFFWRPLLTTAQVPRNGGDLNSFFFPLHAFAAQAIREGSLPFWNPTLFSGMPHWANYQAGALYPLNWLMYLAARPFTYGALEFVVLLHYLIASVGSYLLVRVGLRLAHIPALLAGIVFPYSGFLVAHLGHYSMLAAAVWVPWLWLALSRSIVTGRWAWTVGIGLATFALATGGHQQTVLYALLGSLLWWCGALLRERSESLRSLRSAAEQRDLRTLRRAGSPLLGDAGRAAVGLAAGLALAAPALLPSLELARRSVRAGGLAYEQASEFALRPTALVNFLLPRTFGDNPTNWWGPWASGEVWGYAGTVTLLFAFLGLALSREPLRWLLAGIAVLALLHALGPATPVHGWVYRFVPFADLLRAPARSLLYVDLSLAMLAALGLAAVLERTETVARVLRRTARSSLLALAVLVLLVAPLFLLAIVTSTTPAEPTVRAFESLLLLVLWLGAATFWMRVAASRHDPRTLGVAAVVLVALDLFSVTSPFNPTPEDLLADFRHTEAISFLRRATQDGGPWRMLALTIRWQPSSAAVHMLEDAGGLFDPMQPAAYARALECVRATPGHRLLDLLNVRYLVTRDDADPPDPRFERRLTTASGLAVWENPTALPRAWLTGSATATERRSALDQLCSTDFDPRRTLYLSGALPPADPSATGTALVSWNGPNELRVQVATTAPAYLVVAVSADPGWRARLDGRDAAIATADAIFQAVWVPAGQHTVVLTYRPPYLRWGIALALAGGAALVGALVRDLASRRERR